MPRKELDEKTATIQKLLLNHDITGVAYFTDTDFDEGLALGGGELTEAKVGVAIYRIITEAGFNVERICTAVIMLARSEERRN